MKLISFLESDFYLFMESCEVKSHFNEEVFSPL